MSMPALFHRRRSGALSASIALSVLLLAGCTGVQQPVKGYGEEARDNFVDACTINRTVDDGVLLEEELAPEQFCECTYETMKDVYSLPWDELAEYEDEVANAEPGEMPVPPEQLTKAIEDCSRSTVRGPAPTDPEVSESSEEPDTTEG